MIKEDSGAEANGSVSKMLHIDKIQEHCFRKLNRGYV